MNKNEMIKTTEALISTLEMRDTNLYGHSLHIEKLVLLLYDNLPFSMQLRIKKDDLIYAALFHDIGQIGVSGSIIHKAGKLTKDEWEQIKRHPEISADYYGRVLNNPQVIEGIRYHHERIDGNGYYHISGDRIPLISRILAIADTFSAVTVLKSYKPARSYEDGISALKLDAGTQFDKALVEIFASIPKQSVMQCAEEVRKEIAPIIEATKF